ncbi:MAG TPA: polysaccharide deacetylase family protein [Xanthomonadales bacterium]|nr:polysaccharide deacetylase family protein [Xanthomonadales bacterium]
MTQIRKSSSFNLFGYKVQVIISPPKKVNNYKFNFPSPHARNLFAFAATLFFVTVFAHWAVNTLTNDAYLTKEINLPKSVYYSLLGQKKENKKIVEPKADGIVFHGPRTHKKVALTFDADMTPQMLKDLSSGTVESYYDRNLIDILNQTNTKATLFLSGMWIEHYGSVARELHSNPLFELANHTYSHPGFTGVCYGLTLVEELRKVHELEKTQKLLKAVTGFDNKLFRFPGGCFSSPDLDLVTKTGQVAIQWDVAGQDGFNSDTQNIVSNVVDNAKNGSIIVMHMNGYPNEPVTSQALPLIITSLRERGFEFVTVSELLDMKPTNPVVRINQLLSYLK